jgi:LacI family transcriptional regulator
LVARQKSENPNMTRKSRKGHSTPPTMCDVARLASVSQTTVSFVINNTPNAGISEGTRERVWAAVEQLGYRPNVVARSLKTNRTETIGVIAPDISNLHVGEILLGIEDVVRQRDYSLFVYNTAANMERELDSLDALDLLLRQRVDGIIAASTNEKWGSLTPADLQNVPIVFMDRAYGSLDGPFVGADDKRGAYMGVCHLIEQGHEKIATLAGPQRYSTMSKRLAGFCQVMQDHNITIRKDWISETRLSFEGGYQAGRRLLSLRERPTAIFLNSDVLAAGALLAIHELGLRCPEDISLISFDDHPWARVSNPPLTVVAEPSRAMGRLAAETLLSLIAGKALADSNRTLDCRLILRQSCCRDHG